MGSLLLFGAVDRLLDTGSRPSPPIPRPGGMSEPTTKRLDSNFVFHSVATKTLCHKPICQFNCIRGGT